MWSTLGSPSGPTSAGRRRLRSRCTARERQAMDYPVGWAKGQRHAGIVLFPMGETFNPSPTNTRRTTPEDEMAATAVAGTTSSHALMRCYGRLEGGVVGGDGSGAGGGGGSQLALVLELLAGWDAIGGPPSFSSVTRDVYDPETKVSEGSLPLCCSLWRTPLKTTPSKIIS